MTEPSDKTPTYDDAVFGNSIKDIRTRYAILLEKRRSSTSNEAGTVEEVALQDLSAAIEELNVAQEELRAQNDALREAYATVEDERVQFHDLFRLMPDAYLATDNFGTIVEANHAAEKLLGVDADRMRGKPLAVFIAPEHRAEYRRNIAQVAAGVLMEWDSIIIPRTRAPIPASVRVGSVSTRVPNQRLGVLIHDLSDQRRALDLGQRVVQEQSARVEAERAARRFRALAEVGRQLTLDADIHALCRAVAKTVVRFAADHCEILLLEKGELKSIVVVNREEKLSSFVQALRKRHNMLADNRRSYVWQAVSTGQSQVSPPVAEGGTSRKEWFTALRAHGARNAVALPISYGTETLGVLVAMSTAPAPVFTVEDIGTLEEIAGRAAMAITNTHLFEQLRRANREKADFLAVLSHELRTPLAAVIGYADLLMAGIPHPIDAEVAQHVDRIRTCSWHQLSIVEQVLRYAQITESTDAPRYTDVPVARLCDEVREMVAPKVDERGLRFEVDVPKGDMTLYTDKGSLRQVLLNLVTNALKFTDEGAVSLTVRRDDDDIYFTVSDTGIGIRETDQQRIFDPFWRVEKDQTDGRGGMGLGLAVSKKLITTLNGDITVQSQVGIGTTFVVRLPIN